MLGSIVQTIKRIVYLYKFTKFRFFIVAPCLVRLANLQGSRAFRDSTACATNTAFANSANLPRSRQATCNSASSFCELKSVSQPYSQRRLTTETMSAVGNNGNLC